ncbi:EAL domain-containing protein [Oceanimonas sp. CHS3-5]|uniref:bifunctional diguanylate cyclase/phosphodiesterase n=1 Tax=Oceanimonas sp. CHS3-5 TaxID=3068186 RepID=UPI00273E5C82|nr:EAL domain-containing protein [Oceanimonas sp. CHS3-5]MDP5292478.1 EAL domain-containing protein [Oceanimonas sp. CHS3-5]
MSLNKQLWLAIAVLMLLAFVSSFTISTLSARNYYQEQLQQKNIDNANSLALTLSQVEKDEVTVELLVAAQFDTGHYRRIELIAPSGEVRQRKLFEPAAQHDTVPAWFVKLAALSVPAGVAQVQDGWHQYGTLYVESLTEVAYAALWQTTLRLLGWLLLVALLCGALGSWLLKQITQPLEDVVHQAEAIGGRRFITSSEPRTLEFGRLVRAMNLLSGRVRDMLESESRRLEALRYQHQHDAVTGLANRDTVNSQLDALLSEEDGRHGILLVRVQELATINRTLGRADTDRLLHELAEALLQWAPDQQALFAEALGGRLNGSDFLLLLTEAEELSTLSAALDLRLRALAERWPQVQPQLPHGACYFLAGERRGEVMSRVDGLLATAEQRCVTCAEVRDTFSGSDNQGAGEWRQLLTPALAAKAVSAVRFPVLQLAGDQPLHEEAMMRLQWQGNTWKAGEFMPWARRLGLLPAFDVAMVETVLNGLRCGTPQPVAINLSMETLRQPASRQQLMALLTEAGELAPMLWLEFAESQVIREVSLFREFCVQVKPLGCRLGMERAGRDFAKIAHLQELGLDYLKVDGALLRNLPEHEGNQGFLRGLCSLGHSIGLCMIADGVQSPAERELLLALGFDAAGGPGIRQAG